MQTAESCALGRQAEVVYRYWGGEAGTAAQIFATQRTRNGRRAVGISETGIGLASALLPLRKEDAINLMAPLR